MRCCGRVLLISPERVGLSRASRINKSSPRMNGWSSSRFIPFPTALGRHCCPLESVLVGSSPHAKAKQTPVPAPRPAPRLPAFLRWSPPLSVPWIPTPRCPWTARKSCGRLARAYPHPSCSGNLMVFVCALDELVAAANREGSHPHLRVQLHDRFLFLAVLA